MIDKKLLMDLVSIQSSHTEDTDINNYIVNKLKTIDGVTTELDSFGNIYATKGEGKNGYKCIVSHTDTVHSIREGRKVYIQDGIMFTMAKSNSAYGPKLSQAGTGGDDKCGVYACLKAIELRDDVKAVFFRFEESGCRGSNQSNIKYFDDCNFVIQCDRRGGYDFITHTNGIQVASKDFEDAMLGIGEKYSFKKVMGVSTDVGALKKNGLNVSACNLSCGYYDPHTMNETIVLSELDNTFDFVLDMFDSYGETRFEHKYEKPVQSVFNFTSFRKPKGKGSKKFTNSAFSNFFTNQLNENIIDIEILESSKFVQIGNTKMHKIVGDDILFLDDETCPVCGGSDSIIFAACDGKFYCSDMKHNDFIEDGDVYKLCIIEDADSLYMYDRINDVWIKEEDAAWDIAKYTYVLKSSLVY